MCLAICHERRRVPRPFRALLRPDVLPGAEENPASREQPAAEPLVGGFEHTEVIVVHVDVVIALGRRAEPERILRGPLKAVVADDEPAIVLGERGEPHAGQRLPVLRHRRAEHARRNMRGFGTALVCGDVAGNTEQRTRIGLGPDDRRHDEHAVRRGVGIDRPGTRRLVPNRPHEIAHVGFGERRRRQRLSSERPAIGQHDEEHCRRDDEWSRPREHGDLTIAALQSSSSSSTVRSVLDQRLWL